MFSFFKKKKEFEPAACLKVDVHSHLIPGIDDGSQSMEESISLLRAFEKMGYKKVITTPHIMSDAYKNTPTMINKGLKNLRIAAKNERIALEIEAAAEYYLDDGFFDLLEEGEMLSVDGKYLLFETSYISKPLQLEEMIFGISSLGYIPLLAHPERYRYVKDPEKEFGRLKELGVKFQVNLNSFVGHYGRVAKEHAEYLCQNGMIDFLGSDVHHKKQITFLETCIHSEVYSDIFKYNTILNDDLI